MSSASVVEAFDVLEDRVRELYAGAPARVADAAEVSKATLFPQFPTKDDLFATLVTGSVTPRG